MIIFLILGLYLSNFFANQYMYSLRETLENDASLLSEFVKNMDTDYLEKFSYQASDNLGVRVTIIDNQGVPKAETSKKCKRVRQPFRAS